MERLKAGDLVRFRAPVDYKEAVERFILLENPDGGRALAEGICNLPIRPTTLLRVEDLELAPR